ncbi:hypothetical protein NC652_028123 [Populus alba x Populus x berolinensis]|nr:hypothetical protein NC652_028123 [Populus alba x Populus x berolinensis]
MVSHNKTYEVIIRFDKELNKEVAIKVIDLEESEDEIEDIQKVLPLFRLQSGPPLDEMSIACILRDLLHAIEYLHNEQKIHRDIKAANILLSENGDVKDLFFYLGYTAHLSVLCLSAFGLSPNYELEVLASLANPLHDVFKIMLACRVDVQWDRTKKE